MATVAPLVYRTALGHAGRIAAGDTIDPAYLPSSSSSSYPPTLLAAATTFSIPANCQVLIARRITCSAGSRIVGAAGGVLIGVT